MKKINTLLLFTFCCLLAGAQITLLSTDMPVPGWINAMQKDTGTGAVNWGNKGANQVYDFSRFHNVERDSLYYSTPTPTQLSTVPGATLAITADHNTYIFGQNATALFDFDGAQTVYNSNTLITNFSPIDSEYKFPTAYGQTFSGTYGFTKTVTGSSVGYPAIPNIRFINTTTYTDSIDGWGIVITPVGTYHCLRQHRVENSSTVIQDNALIIYTTVTTINSTTNAYYYLTKEAHGSVITFTYDSLNNPLTASWTTTPPPPPVALFGVTYGAGGTVIFSDSSAGYPTGYSWSFGDGSPASTGVNATHTYAVDTTYVVCLTVTNAGGSNTWCDTVHITNALGLRAPKAVNDAATVTQPGSVTIHVLANDSNFNYPDSVCVTGILGGNTGWASVSGCSQVVYHPLDSNFSGPDSFRYISCDARVATLCDTGTVYVTVRPLLPIAGFSYNSAGQCRAEALNSSQHADSINWTVIFLSANGQYRSVSDVDTFIVAAYNDVPFQAQVCLTAVNTSGSSVLCDTINWVCAGINEIAAPDFKIYPDPATDQISIDLSQMAEASTIEMYDLIGAKIKTTTVNGSISTIPVGDLSNGVYLIGMTDKDQNRKMLGKFEILR